MIRGTLLLLALARVAAAEPEAPLAQIQDEKQLSQLLATITSDPTIPVTDPKARKSASALMIEGVKQVRASSYEQGLANFLDAYARFPSPRILLNIGSTLFDMSRFADAANTYQRYLFDPIAQKERLAEVKDLLNRLDGALTILTIRVYPQGAQVSIDAGPFITVEHSLQTRVRAGTHTVRVRKTGQNAEVTLNGFEGENKEVIAALPGAQVEPPDTVEPQHEWLQTGRAYSSDDEKSTQRHVNAGFGGPAIPSRMAHFDNIDPADLVVKQPEPEPIASGAIGLMRVDGKLRGVAAGFGIAIARDQLEGDAMYLRSDENGFYLGARWRFLTGQLRPYAAAGIPCFVFSAEDPQNQGVMQTRLAVGLRAAGGIEIEANGHLSVQLDLGIEHFWRIDNTNFEAWAFVPTVGVIGRL